MPAMQAIRILHVANFNQFKYGAWYMNLDAKLSAGLSQLGHYVYNFSQRDVARSENPFKSKSLGKKAMIEALFTTVQNLKPQLVVLGHSEMIDPVSLKQLRSELPDTPFVMWYCDPLFKEYEDTFDVPLLRERAPLLDAIFTTTGVEALKDITQGQCDSGHIPNWVHLGCESGKAFSNSNLKNSLIYAGNDYNLEGRKQALQNIVNSDVGPKFKLYQALGNPRIHGQAYYDSLSESLMGLSLSRRIDVPWYTSDRMQQTMGNGVCVVSPMTPGLTDLFKGDEAVWFDSEEEITELVSWYSNNPDQTRSIAERGWKAVHERCSAQRVAQYILERVFKTGLSEDYEWCDQFSQAS